MKEKIVRIGAAIAAMILSFTAVPFEVMATETADSPCTISVSVDDALGIYDGTIEIIIQTPNEEKKMEFDSRTWGLANTQSIVTTDFGNAYAFGKFSVEGFELVFADSYAPLAQYTVSSGDTVRLNYVIIPSADNAEYGEYNAILKNGEVPAETIAEDTAQENNSPDSSSNMSNVIFPDETASEVKAAESEDAYIKDGAFDFETWYVDAKAAYEAFKAMAETYLYEESWSRTYDYYDGIGRSAQKREVGDYVSGMTQEDFEELAVEDVLIYYATYLKFAGMTSTSVGRMQYEDYFVTYGEDGFKDFYNKIEGPWSGDGVEELKDAYETFVPYQVIYCNYYSFPYNFVTDKTYAEETGLSSIVQEEGNESGLTDSEIEEIKEALEEEGIDLNELEAEITGESAEETSKSSIWTPVWEKIKGVWFTLLILAVLVVALVVVKKVRQKQNVDEMTDDGK